MTAEDVADELAARAAGDISTETETDLLNLNGYDLRKLPLIERKAHLKTLIAGTAIQFSESFAVSALSVGFANTMLWNNIGH